MDQVQNPQIIANIPMINEQVMRMTSGGQLLPYIVDHVYCNYGKNYFTTFAEMWMDKEYDSDTEIYHTEESQQIYVVTVAANATASGAGAQVTIDYGQNVINGYTNVQPGFWVAVPPIGKMAKVISVNPNNHTMVIEPNDIAYQITVTEGQQLIIAPAAIVASCGCDRLPTSKKLPGLMYKSTMMIIKKTLTICGEDLAKWLKNRRLFAIKSLEDPCVDVNVWWHADLDNLWFDFMYAKQMFAMLGEDITNNTENFEGLKSTTGVMHMLRSRATQLPVAASTGIDFDWFTRFTARLKRLRNYCDQYSLWSGANHRAQIDLALEGKVTKNDVSWNFLQGDIQRGLRLGFDGLKLNGIEFYLHDEASLNDPGFLGAEGFNGPDTTFGLPLCRVPCGNRLSTPIIVRYLAGNGINRELIENDYGVLRPGSNFSHCDYHEWSLMSQFGLDAYCLNYWVFAESI